MKKISLILMFFLVASSLLIAAPQDKKVNINQATEAELQELPGIGPALAGRIVEHRQKNGPFVKLVDLLNVSGIGAKKFEALEQYLTLGAQATSKNSSPSKPNRGRTPPSG